MVKGILRALSVYLALIAVTHASANPISIAPMPIVVNGDVKVVFIAAWASDHTFLSEVGGDTAIFCHGAVGSCAGTAPGTVADLGIQNGTIAFSLTDVTVPNLFDTVHVAVDGYFHARVATTYDGLGIYSEPIAAEAIIAGLTTPDDIIYYVSFEDRVFGDYDYNDFVFAVIDPPRFVPEAPTYWLALAGILMLIAFSEMGWVHPTRFVHH